ncbi:MOSC N-terminal beta barrel domain-containing protein [Halogeometricum sp. S1BR25-6]|uniref:MOSC N-terminal beta barrel domain-containing protein n=1 Tax=Halogeometricum salsisoli TaxID=2950536 RepID=A0ABU2GFE3_9EURY|nr:MOSC N-terminal beta barrel domain-containing protein [Halogeometricum sp. S1BR25-6]MDS0299059.1 MOSC N-terminal beta barrel domain-containing protein [Halogeometricum sp. S1BR25-6]
MTDDRTERTSGTRFDPDDAPTAVVRRLTTFPVKSLDGCDRESVRVVRNGGLDGDREFALFDSAGEYVNGKRERSIHRVGTEFDPETRTLGVTLPDRETERFDVDDDGDRGRLTGLLSEHVGYEVSLRRNRDGGFPDDTEASGPTVVSTATLREVASWFDGISVKEMRRRLRANVELGGLDGDLPAFWEDRLFDRRGRVVDFRIGDVEFAGVNPCQRCVVPSRDPDTGAAYDGFRETFVRRRRETMPAWSGGVPERRSGSRRTESDGDWFDHDFRLMVNTRVAASSWGETLAVGDEVRVGDSRPTDD